MTTEPRNSPRVETVATLAAERKLSEAFLRQQVQLEDAPGGGVRLPYFDEAGNHLFAKVRGAPNGPRFHLPAKSRLTPYGLWRRGDWNGDGVLFLTEGESDTWPLWFVGIPALGLPGVNSCGCLRREHLEGIRELYLCPDNDDAGRQMIPCLARQLNEIAFPGKAFSITLPPGVKDVSDLHRADPEQFLTAWAGLTAAARPLAIRGKAPGGSSDWPDPLPLSIDPAVPPFPVHLLPPVLADWVSCQAEATQTPPDLSAMLALAIAGRFRVRVRDGWQEPLNLFTVVALPPGERKSAVFAAAMAPVVEHERRERERLGPIVAEAMTERRQLEARLKHLEAQAAKKSGVAAYPLREEARQAARELANHRIPPLPQLYCDDITPEMLAKRLAEQGGRILQAGPEGTAFEIAKGRYSEGGKGNFDVYLKGHAGDPLRVDRVGREADIVASPALSVALAVQPDVIRGLIDHGELRHRGFLARFLYALPVSMVGSRQIAPPPVPLAVAEAYLTLILRLWELEAEATDPQVLAFSDPADAVIREFERRLEPRLKAGEELCSARPAADRFGATGEGVTPDGERVQDHRRSALAAQRLGRAGRPALRIGRARRPVREGAEGEGRHARGGEGEEEVRQVVWPPTWQLEADSALDQQGGGTADPGREGEEGRVGQGRSPRPLRGPPAETAH